MRTFRDSNDNDWVVFEVRREVSAKGDWSYLPSGFSDGWLCFESAAAKRRLVRYPERWKEFTDTQLQALLTGAGLTDVRVRVGARTQGDPFVVLLAVGTKPRRRRQKA